MKQSLLLIALVCAVFQVSYAQQSKKPTFLPDSVLDVEKKVSFIDQMSVYPNPASDKIKISNHSFKNVEVTIYNIVGDVILVKQSGVREIIFDISRLSDGVYIVAFNNGEEVVTQRLVKNS